MAHYDLYVYDSELTKELTWLNLMDYVDGFDTFTDIAEVNFFFKDNRIYYHLEYTDASHRGHTRLAFCTIEALLSGKPNFITLLDQ